MEDEKVFPINVKFDGNYKAIANDIRNGLGVKKEDIDDYIQKFAEEAVRRYVMEHSQQIDKIVDNAFNDTMKRLFSNKNGFSWERNFSNYVSQAIDSEVKKKVAETVAENIEVRLKGGKED